VSAPRSIPLWLKLIPTAYLAVLIPVYIGQGGLGSLLWYCDIALIGTAIALWLEHRLLACVMALCALSFGLGWNIDYAIRLAGGPGFLGYSAYMFDESLPRYARALSLYHVPLPFLQMWLVYRLGYDRRALLWQCLAGTLIVWTTYGVSEMGWVSKSSNINRVYGLGDPPNTWGMAPPLWVLAMCFVLPLGFYLPTHIALDRLWGVRPANSAPEEAAE